MHVHQQRVMHALRDDPWPSLICRREGCANVNCDCRRTKISYNRCSIFWAALSGESSSRRYCSETRHCPGGDSSLGACRTASLSRGGPARGPTQRGPSNLIGVDGDDTRIWAGRQEPCNDVLVLRNSETASGVDEHAAGTQQPEPVSAGQASMRRLAHPAAQRSPSPLPHASSPRCSASRLPSRVASSTRRSNVSHPHWVPNFERCFADPSCVHSASTRTRSKSNGAGCAGSSSPPSGQLQQCSQGAETRQLQLGLGRERWCNRCCMALRRLRRLRGGGRPRAVALPACPLPPRMSASTHESSTAVGAPGGVGALSEGLRGQRRHR